MKWINYLDFKKGMDMLDSPEEVHFYWYLQELKHLGIIKGFRTNVEPFELSEKKERSYIDKIKTKSKTGVQTLLREHSYKPDYVVLWNEIYKDIFYSCYKSDMKLALIWRGEYVKRPFITNGNVSHIDIKGSYTLRNSDNAIFSVNRKWVMDRYGVYIDKITVPDVFIKTFTPNRYLYTDKTQSIRTSMKWQDRTIHQYFNLISK